MSEVKVFDADGKERDMEWARKRYNITINECPRDEDHWEIVELREKVECAAAFVVYIIGEATVGIPVAWFHTGGEFKSEPWEPKPRKDVQKTNQEGHTGFGMGRGAYYDPRVGPGPHAVWITRPVTGVRSDELDGIGMVRKTNHNHIEPVFQFVKAGEPGPGPGPGPEPVEGLTFDVSGTITLKQRR